MTLMAIPTLAEVCDKMAGDGWQAGDGVLLQWLPWALEQSGILAIGLIAVWYFGLRRASFILGLIFSVLGTWTICIWASSMSNIDPTLQLALDEGCVSRTAGVGQGILELAFGMAFLLVARLKKTPSGEPAKLQGANK